MDFDESGRAIFTDAERAEIAREHDELAASLWQGVTRAEGANNIPLADKLRIQAGDAMDIAEAARISSARLARIY
jgi:hypothetical protein